MIRSHVFTTGTYICAWGIGLALMTGAAVDGAPRATADPACHADDPQCQIVPGMQDAVQGQPCDNWTRYTYGFDPNGSYLACVSFDGGKTGMWSKAATLAGVKTIGSPCCAPDVSYCPTGYGTLAQAPDGRPLLCADGIWVAPPRGNLG